MFDFGYMDKVNRLIQLGAASRMSDKQFVAREISNWLASKKRRLMITGMDYFYGKQDIDNKERTGIGRDGQVETIENIPNNRVKDNLYRKLVNQKKGYLFGSPFTVQCEDDTYTDLLNDIYDARFMRLMKQLGEDALNCGIAWLYPYYNSRGELSFKRFAPYTVLPFWSDAEHTKLECAIRVYDVLSYEGTNERTITKVEVYEDTGITYFEYDSGGLIACEPWHTSYFTATTEQHGEIPMNWSRVPLIAFKYNSQERPLIAGTKSLQDAINTILSNFTDNMEEDVRNTIMVLVNYDGENLGEFRHNLATYGAVKVHSTDGVSGDVKTLQVQVDSSNYQAILEVLKKAIIENGMGFDAKDDRLNGNANQMNLQAIYNDIDLDANDMELEFQAGLDELRWYIDCHLANTGKGDYFDVPVDIHFNRNMMVNKSEQIDNCKNSVGLLSKKTILANHPFVTDVDAELDQIDKENQANLENFGLQPKGQTIGEQETDEQ